MGAGKILSKTNIMVKGVVQKVLKLVESHFEWNSWDQVNLSKIKQTFIYEAI